MPHNHIDKKDTYMNYIPEWVKKNNQGKDVKKEPENVPEKTSKSENKKAKPSKA